MRVTFIAFYLAALAGSVLALPTAGALHYLHQLHVSSFANMQI